MPFGVDLSLPRGFSKLPSAKQRQIVNAKLASIGAMINEQRFGRLFENEYNNFRSDLFRMAATHGFNRDQLQSYGFGLPILPRLGYPAYR